MPLFNPAATPQIEQWFGNGGDFTIGGTINQTLTVTNTNESIYVLNPLSGAVFTIDCSGVTKNRILLIQLAAGSLGQIDVTGALSFGDFSLTTAGEITICQVAAAPGFSSSVARVATWSFT